MAVRSNITPARINATWAPAAVPMAELDRFFKRGGRGASPVIASPRPMRPAPAMEVA